jgi:hypothetical protein
MTMDEDLIVKCIYVRCDGTKTRCQDVQHVYLTLVRPALAVAPDSDIGGDGSRRQRASGGKVKHGKIKKRSADQ